MNIFKSILLPIEGETNEVPAGDDKKEDVEKSSSKVRQNKKIILGILLISISIAAGIGFWLFSATISRPDHLTSK